MSSMVFKALMLAGGAHLSVESVRAAAIGLLTGAPIAALYAALWTPEARKAFPALEDMHKAECEPLDALFEGMSAAQVCLSTLNHSTSPDYGQHPVCLCSSSCWLVTVSCEQRLIYPTL